MTLVLEVENASALPTPSAEEFHRWVAQTLATAAGSPARRAEINLRIVDESEMADLNTRFRQRAGATNVLSFPADLPASLQLPLLGDIAICAPVVLREASAQHKAAEAHWAHLSVHGTLHLLGHDHSDPQEADAMEALETRILASLGIACPYTQRDAATPHRQERAAP